MARKKSIVSAPRQRKNITEIAYSESYPCSSVDGFIQELLEVKMKIPESCRETARVRIEEISYPYSGDIYHHFQVYYERPETDKEFEERIAMESVQTAKWEENERLHYERLKAKYDKS